MKMRLDLSLIDAINVELALQAYAKTLLEVGLPEAADTCAETLERVRVAKGRRDARINKLCGR